MPCQTNPTPHFNVCLTPSVLNANSNLKFKMGRSMKLFCIWKLFQLFCFCFFLGRGSWVFYSSSQRPIPPSQTALSHSVTTATSALPQHCSWTPACFLAQNLQQWIVVIPCFLLLPLPLDLRNRRDWVCDRCMFLYLFFFFHYFTMFLWVLMLWWTIQIF